MISPCIPATRTPLKVLRWIVSITIVLVMLLALKVFAWLGLGG